MIVQPIGKFKLTYANGISQVKLLITQEDYKSIVKPILDNIAELEAQRSGINKKSKRYKEISEKLRELKKPISELLKKEVDKCILLCCRCHREVHAGVITL